MISPNHLVPYIVPVLAKKKLGMCCAVSSMGMEIAVKNEAAPVFPFPCGAAVGRRFPWRSLVLEELWDSAPPKLCCLLWVLISHADALGGVRKGVSTSLLHIFLTQLLRRQQWTQSLLLALLQAVFQLLSTEPTNYMCFSLSCIWCVSDEILGKISVLFAIYSDIMSVLVNKRVGGFKLWKHHEHHHDTHAPRILLVMKICRCWS